MTKFTLRRLNGGIEFSLGDAKVYLTPAQARTLAKDLDAIANPNVIEITLDATQYKVESDTLKPADDNGPIEPIPETEPKGQPNSPA